MTDLLALSPDAQDLLFRDARTANAFTDEPVSDEQVAAIYDLVKYAPTAMNSQPLRVVLLRSDEARATLLKHMGDGNRDKTETAPLVAVLAAGPMTGFDAAGIDADLFEGTGLKTLVVVNIGHPGENAWFDRLPRLEHDEAVLTY